MTQIFQYVDPTSMPLLLVGAVFAASMLQAVTGIGFGVIAGPVLLVTMANSGAIQVSILLSFLIALLLSPKTVPKANYRLLKPLCLGVCLGTPLGALAFLFLSLDTLKLCAAIVVGLMTLIAAGLFARFPVFERDTLQRRIGVGTLCGILNTTLAMPGPPVAAYATAIKSDKQTIRATTLVTFLLAYPIAFAFQYALSGIPAEAVRVAAGLLVPTIGGTLFGLLISGRVSEVFFRFLTILFLSIGVVMLVL